MPHKWLRLLSLLLREEKVTTRRDRGPLLYSFLQSGYVCARFRREDISHIHAHFLHGPTNIALFASQYLNTPFSFTMHSGQDIFRDPPMLWTALDLCRKAVTISDYNKRYLAGRFGDRLSGKIEVIHCGVDTEIFKPQPRAPNGRPLVVAAGRLVEMKGFRYLVDACKILKDRGLSFTCQLAGSGEDMMYLKGKVASLGLDDVLTLLGAQQEKQILKLLREASVFVLPSIITAQGACDGIPVALMEAMAMEVPVVSTKIVGIPELIEDQTEGLLVEQRNPEQLASAIEFLLHNPTIRAEMGRRGRAKVERDFNIANVPSLLRNVFGQEPPNDRPKTREQTDGS
jgi:glycosyltransferase involved in cell wall biosynthesis